MTAIVKRISEREVERKDNGMATRAITTGAIVRMVEPRSS